MPLGGDPDLACKQKPHGRAYWVECGFCDLPVKGSVVRRLGIAGWDNLRERDGSSTGLGHRDGAIERTHAATAQGHKSVILAGQSHGGAISLEANAKATSIDGVLAVAPGHGSDAASGATGRRKAVAAPRCGPRRQRPAGTATLARVNLR